MWGVGGGIRVLLNKADAVDAQSLLRVYGALMWSLSKVVHTPEASRVYLGSFWEAPLKMQDNRYLGFQPASLMHRYCLFVLVVKYSSIFVAPF